MLSGIDMCIDATDSFASRLIVSDACADASVDEILCSAEIKSDFGQNGAGKSNQKGGHGACDETGDGGYS